MCLIFLLVDHVVPSHKLQQGLCILHILGVLCLNSRHRFQKCEEVCKEGSVFNKPM